MGIVEAAHNVKVLGSGDQFIVLGHGFGADQSIWKHLVPHLVDDFKVVVYDNMGAGTTNPDYFDFERHSTMEGFAYDLISILEETQVNACIYVGHSFSAMVGAIASVIRPDLFSKLIFLNGTPRLINCSDYVGGFEKEDIEQLFEGMRSNYRAWCSGFAPLVVGGDMDSAAVQEFCRTLFNMRPDIALSLAHSLFLSDIREILPLVTVPCHILQSKDDMAVPVIVADYIHQQLKCPTVIEVMPTDGHLPQLSSPDIVIPVVLRHVRCDIPGGSM